MIDYRITDKRRERIIEEVLSIINEFKDMDEVEAIALRSYKGTTHFRNFLDGLSGFVVDNGYTHTGNELYIVIIRNTDKQSDELRDKIWDVEYQHRSLKICSKLGVDIKIASYPSNHYTLLSDDDRNKIIRLYEMMYSDEVSYEELLDYVKKEVYPEDYTIRNHKNYFNFISKKKIASYNREMTAFDAINYIDKWITLTRGLGLSYVVLDKTHDQHFKKIAEQFKGHVIYKQPKNMLGNRSLDLKINDQISMRLNKKEH